MRWSIVALALLVVVSLSGPAFAATLKVPKDHESIQEAVDAAEAGDTIIVSKGTYYEHVEVTKNGLRLIGKKAIWDGNIGGSEGTCLNITGDAVLVQGFRFLHGRDQVNITGSDAVVTKCVFTNANDVSVDIDGANARVEKCVMRGMENEAINIDGDGALISKNRISNGGDGGIDISGNDVVVERNNISVVEDDDTIYVSGDRARIERNVCMNADGDGVEVSGDDAVVERNKVSHFDGYGIYVSGDGARVERNAALSTHDEGIYVSGDDFQVLGNKVAHCVDDTDGIEVSGDGNGKGSAVVEGNKVIDVVEDGIYINGSGIRVVNNSVQRSGGEDESAFYVSGNDNYFSGNKVVDYDSNGFYVNGDRNVFENCTASLCTDDGFSFSVNASDNEVRNCTAINCTGEGIENFGGGTIVTGSKFLKNRLDVTNDGTYATFDGNTFKTGGTETPAEVDALVK